MIAEAPATLTLDRPTISAPRPERRTVAPLTLARVTAALQLVLAARRSEASDDHGYWYSIARGL